MTYWIVSTHSANNRRIHDDRDCPAIQNTVATVREAKDDEIDRYGPCSFCAGDLPDPAHYGEKFSTTVSELNPEDLGLEPMEESQ